MLNNIIKNKKGHIVIWQLPNTPLLLWFIFTIAARFIHQRALHSGFEFISTSALFTWAYLELRYGESWFRKMLGGVVITFTTLGHFK